MAYEVRLPQVGESVTEAIIGKWLRDVGDPVEKFDPLVEVVTDKVTMEVPSPADGLLTRVLAVEGETVRMGAVIAEMELTGTAPQELEAPRAERIGRMVEAANVGPTGGVFSDASLGLPADNGSPEAAEAREAAAPAVEGARRLSPVAVRLATEHGIALDSIEGTGAGGRVTKRDVLAAVERRDADGVRTAGDDEGDRLKALSPVRRQVAAQVARSAAEIPHAWSAVEVDVTGMVACRETNRGALRERRGVDLTYLPFVLHAVTGALRANPLVNSSWEDGKIRVKDRINVGVAVAGREGLVVPVVHDADGESVEGLAVRVAPLVERARAGTLGLEDVQGGTFTLNNTGALGSVWGGAIINHPQAAILTMEAVVKRPVVVSGPEGDAVEVRSMMNVCLSFDHRVLDGAESAAFLQDVKRRLEAFGPDSAID